MTLDERSVCVHRLAITEPYNCLQRDVHSLIWNDVPHGQLRRWHGGLVEEAINRQLRNVASRHVEHSAVAAYCYLYVKNERAIL